MRLPVFRIAIPDVCLLLTKSKTIWLSVFKVQVYFDLTVTPAEKFLTRICLGT
jgi:hypothetical protein